MPGSLLDQVGTCEKNRFRIAQSRVAVIPAELSCLRVISCRIHLDHAEHGADELAGAPPGSVLVLRVRSFLCVGPVVASSEVSRAYAEIFASSRVVATSGPPCGAYAP